MREKEGSVCCLLLFLILSLLPSISLLVRNLSRASGFSVCVSVSVSMSSSTVFALSAPALLVSVLHREPFSFVFPHKKSVKEDRRRVSYNQPYLLNNLHVFCSSSSSYLLVSVLNTNKLAFLFPTDDGIFSQSQKICERLMTPQEDRRRKDAQEGGEIQGKNNVKERLACTKKENTYL
jgi:hypothetical protein